MSNSTGEHRRRAEDQLVAPMFYVGILCLLIAGALTTILALTKTPFTWPVVVVIIVFAVIGGLLMPTDRVLRGLRIWRKNGNGDRLDGGTGGSH